MSIMIKRKFSQKSDSLDLPEKSSQNLDMNIVILSIYIFYE